MVQIDSISNPLESFPVGLSVKHSGSLFPSGHIYLKLLDGSSSIFEVTKLNFKSIKKIGFDRDPPVKRKNFLNLTLLRSTVF